MAFIPQCIVLAVFNLEESVIDPSTYDFPAGPVGWCLCLAQWIIFSLMSVPLLLPTLLRLTHVIDNGVTGSLLDTSLHFCDKITLIRIKNDHFQYGPNTTR